MAGDQPGGHVRIGDNRPAGGRGRRLGPGGLGRGGGVVAGAAVGGVLPRTRQPGDDGAQPPRMTSANPAGSCRIMSGVATSWRVACSCPRIFHDACPHKVLAACSVVVSVSMSWDCLRGYDRSGGGCSAHGCGHGVTIPFRRERRMAWMWRGMLLVASVVPVAAFAGSDMCSLAWHAAKGGAGRERLRRCASG